MRRRLVTLLVLIAVVSVLAAGVAYVIISALHPTR